MDHTLRKRFVWPRMHMDIAAFCKACTDCQKSKVFRHTILKPASFTVPEFGFRHVHIDLVGPYPDDHGFSYCKTMIERFSEWPEAVPLKNIEAATVCRAFVDGWNCSLRSARHRRYRSRQPV